MKRRPTQQLCAPAALSVNAPCSLSACVHLMLVPTFHATFVSRTTWGTSMKEERLKLIVDRAEMQHKIHEEEPDIVWIMGWCYVPEEDNAFYDKKIVLQRADGGGYTAVPADWNRKDVEASLRGEQHIELAGFVLRVLKKDLEAGSYQIGMLCTNQVYGDKVFAWSEKWIEISER